MKKLITLIISILLPYLTLIAQVEFEKNVILNEDQLKRPNVVFLADINNDGNLDMVAGSSHDGIIGWHQNIDGTGSYGEMITIDTEVGNLKSIYVADINNDGYPDIVFCNLNYGIIGWYENLDGLGSFGPMQVITSVPSGYSSVIAKDIDGDGNLDIIATCRFSREIVWYKSLDGLGNFSEAKVIDTNVSQPHSVFAADIDGDGALDIVSTLRGSNKIVWYKNIDGLGSFGSQNLISYNLSSPEGLFVVDLDGDGDMDVLVTNDNSKLYWFENLDGNGNFSDEQEIADNQSGVSNVLAVDIDNDGDLDVVGIGSSLVWYEHEIDNNEIVFENRHIITSHISTGNAIASGDIDNDGNIDIAIASIDNNFIAWYKNNGNGDFERENFISLFAFHPNDIIAVDIDGDSDLDIVFTDWIDEKIVWLENVQGGEKFIPHFIATNVTSVANIAFADIDNDGFVDIVSTSLNDIHIAWYKNDGHGNFEKYLIESGPYGGSKSVKIADMDGDGFKDIITSLGHQLIWFKNQDGQGNFDGPRLIAEMINSNSLSIADMNGDGSNDIVSVSKIEGKHLYFENINNADYFISHRINTQNKYSLSVLTMDVDDDDKLDIISSDENTGTGQERIIWYKNLGNGDFSQESIITSSVKEPMALVTGDLDMDGIEDLIYISLNDKKIAWHKGQTGIFGNQQVIDLTPELPRALYVGDIDQNGSPDIIAAFSHPGKIVWYKNLTPLSINSPTQFNKIKIFPNPTADYLKIDSPNKIVKISLYDLSGRQILVQLDSNTINLSQQSPGLYLLKLLDLKGSSEVVKIIKK